MSSARDEPAVLGVLVGLLQLSAIELLGSCGAPPAQAPSATNPAIVAVRARATPTGESLDTLRAKLRTGLGDARELNLAAQGLGPELGGLLADSAQVAQLTGLNVSDNDLGLQGARDLARSPHLSGILDLDLGGNDIGDDGAEALAHASAFARLETLNVSGNSLSGRGAELLVAGSATQLSSLDLSMNGIGTGGASALAHSKQPLRALYLLGCEIGANGVKELAATKSLKRLEVLALSGNSVGDEGAQTLAQSSAFQNLTTLDLCANGIGDVGALALAQSTHLKKLQVLELFGNRDIGQKGSAALRKRFGAGLHL